MRRVAPAFALFFLAPLVAEYLLGDFPITLLPALVLLAPLYGGGAILIREVVRRTGRGWPSMILLATAYGVFEEAFVTESLFDPRYANAHLLDHGFVPALGIAIPWTLFVVTLHAVWSISVPIALVEGLTPQRRTVPWLRTPGLIVTTVLLAIGAVVLTVVSYADDHFIAPWPTLAVALLVVIALVVTAFRLPRRATAAGTPPVAPAEASALASGASALASDGAPTTSETDQGPKAPSPWILFAMALAAGAVFEQGDRLLPDWAAVTTLIAIYVVMIVSVRIWSGRPGWDARHRLALAGGALLTYAWHCFLTRPLMGDGPVITPVSHIVLALGAVLLLAFELRALRTGTRPSHPSSTAAPALLPQ